MIFIGPSRRAHQVQTQIVWAISRAEDAFKQRPPKPIGWVPCAMDLEKRGKGLLYIMCSAKSARGDGIEREREDHAINSTVCAGCVCKRVGSLPCGHLYP